MTGEEMFSKENGLNLKSLEKMDKCDRVSTVELYLSEFVDYSFNESFKRTEDKYRPMYYKLLLSKAFLKSVVKIYNEDDSIPVGGLVFMLCDAITRKRQVLDNEERNERESNKPASDKENTIKANREEYIATANRVAETIDAINGKVIKSLKKLGVKKEYCAYLSSFFPAVDYMNDKNAQRMIRLLTNGLYSVYTTSLDEDGNTTLGLDLGSPKSMGKLMNIITKEMTTGQLALFIEHILLEKRDKEFDHINPKARCVYNSITKFALDTLEDKEIFNKKTRANIIKDFSMVRLNDEKRGFDAKRRVTFTEIDETMYPRIAKAVESLK